MIGLARQSIATYVPEHLQAEAFRLFDLGYEVNYRTVRPNPKKSRTVPREVLDAQNENFTQLRLTVAWTLTRGPLLTLEGSVRDAEGEQLKLITLDGMEAFWAFAESEGLCPCGGRVLTERSARSIVGRARRHGDDVDMYRCSGWTEFFHVTDNPYPKKMRS
jgi:hypothetical protein